MLTRSKLHHGEGKLEEFDLEIGSRRGRMSSPKGEETTLSIPSKGEFMKAFMIMKTMVEEFYQDQKKGEQGGPSHIEGKKEGGGEEPPKTPPTSPSFLDGSIPSPFEKQKTKVDLNMPHLKLDIKFELPVSNGELNAEKLDNWIHQIEVYYRIQKFTEDDVKI
jgi:hypothetical protein